MATTKQSSLIGYELDFLEKKLKELEIYISQNPYSELSDRMGTKFDKSGQVVQYVIAKKEDQRKDITLAIRDYAEITKIVSGMREQKEKELQVRGGKEASRMAKKFLT